MISCYLHNITKKNWLVKLEVIFKLKVTWYTYNLVKSNVIFWAVYANPWNHVSYFNSLESNLNFTW